MVDRRIVEEWLQKAESDFQFGVASLADTSFWEQICFLFQQAAEKYLKALIVAHELPFRKIHDLNVLLKMIQQKFPEFSELKGACGFLTGFYLEPRYPDYPNVKVRREDAERAKVEAEKIKIFVEKHL